MKELCHENCSCCCDKTDFRFAEESTCHGFSRFCNSWHVGRRLFWLALVLFSMGLLGFQLHDRFSLFLKFEVKTDIGVANVAKYPLPAVTICNMNMFTKSLLDQMDIELLKISSSLITWILTVNQKMFYSHTPPLNTSEIYWAKVAEFEKLEKEILARYNATNFSVDSWIHEKGWQLNDSAHSVVIDCSIGRYQCGTEFFTPVLTPQGRCYTINPQTQFWQTSPGSEAGFNILLDIDQNEYTAWKLDSEKQFECGAKVLLHESYDKLYTGTNLAPYIGVPPGVVGYIAARPLERDMAYEPPWIDCEENMLYPKRSCIAECTARDTLKKCSCRLWFESGTEPLCGVARTTACLVYKETNLPEKESVSEYQCYSSCKHACTEKSFSVGVSYTLLTSNNTIGEFAEYINIVTNFSATKRYTRAFIKRNLLSLQIAYPDLIVDTAHSSPAFGLSAFLSDLGGQLGLFAGISVVTIAELLEYPFIKIYSLYQMHLRRKRRREEHRHSSNASAGTSSSVTSIDQSDYSGRHHNHRASVVLSQHQVPRRAHSSSVHFVVGQSTTNRSLKAFTYRDPQSPSNASPPPGYSSRF